MISAVLPTALTVSNLERSLEFYRDLLGFDVAAELPPAAERDRWDRYHQLVCKIPDAQIKVAYLAAPDGQTHLELIEYVRPRVPPRPRPGLNEPGTSIVALATGDSHGAVERLRAVGVEVLSDPIPYTSDDGVSSLTTYLYDPDGNTLCLFEVSES